jgi:hypothetical protein
MGSSLKPRMTPLIEKHFSELQFDLRLKFKDDAPQHAGKYVGASGPVDGIHEALYFTCGPLGESRHFLVRWYIEDSGVEWLRNVPERHLEVVSELGEM